MVTESLDCPNCGNTDTYDSKFCSNCSQKTNLRKEVRKEVRKEERKEEKKDIHCINDLEIGINITKHSIETQMSWQNT
ncbi:hypothetical protein MNBD_GAMMA01-1031 [hydrothermal vent metagenome]|uniref:Uncharacterized protein n=1 Tax=hydrothermal vent metagenome TaxID=652676 RepID=A0A3B0VNV3_9ZZZZ